jgi:hypothetical protein
MKTKQEILERIKEIDGDIIEIEKALEKNLPTKICNAYGNDLVKLWERKAILEWVLS